MLPLSAFRNVVSLTRSRKLNEVLKKIEVGESDGEKALDSLLNYNDLRYVSRCRTLKILNFQPEDIDKIKSRLKRDFRFLRTNDITNFSF